jgi:translation initiation factor IF-3
MALSVYRSALSAFLTSLFIICRNGAICSGFVVSGPNQQTFRRAMSTKSSLSMVQQKRGRPKGPVRTVEIRPPMNNDIEFDELRVVVPSSMGGNAKDESIGIMSKAEAISKAREFGVDLILINEHGDPPVCKIMDYSKFRYMKEKLLKEKKKGSKGTEVKEVKMSYKIDVHDYEVRKRSIEKFATQGNRVKCSVIFKGREIQHDALGLDLLDRLAKELSHICVTEGKPKRDGKTLGFWLTPRPEVLKKINEKKRAEERAAKKKRQEGMESKQNDKMSPTADAGDDSESEEEDEDEEETDEDLEYDEDDGVEDIDDDAAMDALVKKDDATNNLFA